MERCAATSGDGAAVPPRARGAKMPPRVVKVCARPRALACLASLACAGAAVGRGLGLAFSGGGPSGLARGTVQPPRILCSGSHDECANPKPLEHRGQARRSRDGSTPRLLRRRSSAASLATDQTRGSLPPLLQLSRSAALWKIALPTIAIGLLRSAYGIIDSIWVGRLGAAQLAAMGASSFAFWVLLLLGEVASIGVHSVAAAREGNGSRDGVGEAVIQGLWFSLICGLLSLCLTPLISMYFQLLGVASNSEVLAAGSEYLRGLVWGALPFTASGVLASGFKGIAELRPVLVVNAVCVALNFVLDPVFMWGWFGVPAMGVAGAAHATNLCALVSCVISFRMLQKEDVPLKWRPPDWKIVAQIMRIGLPISLGGLLFTVIYMVLGRLLGSLGGANLAALGLGHRVEALAYTVSEGFGAAAATTVGQWLGAGYAKEAREAATYTARAAALVMLPLAVAFLAFARPIIALITTDPATVGPAVSYLRIVGATFSFMGIEHAFDGALTGAGDTTPCLVWGFVLNAIRIPIALWLCQSYGVEGVWIAISFSTVLKAFAMCWAFRRSPLPLLRRPV
mmetsp:Transcript_25348/g.72323  ORF Transcript_25348/g.72323 Transcript_25348/m.72323 type:complete len:569 (+) Transcript_25348:38-1744(+)